MTFKETIDALIPIYQEGMKAESFDQLRRSKIDAGFCYAAHQHFGVDITLELALSEYKKLRTSSGCFWFTPAMFRRDRQIDTVIDQCIRPRLELLKRIQKDLNEEKI